MITKVYFPRLVIPVAPVLSKAGRFWHLLVDFVWLDVVVWLDPHRLDLTLPVLILLMMLAAAGAGMWLTALAIQYRDIRYGLSFFVRLLMYASPVIYATGTIPERYQLLYALNPMVGVIEGFRAALLGTKPMPWAWIGIGALTAVFLFVTGALYFRRMERVFADVA